MSDPDVFRNLIRGVLSAPVWIERNDASRNAAFAYMLGRLQVTGGTANSLECGLLHPQGFTALQDGATMWLVPEADNTGPVEIDIEGIGTVPLRDVDGEALEGGELVADKAMVIGYYDDGVSPELRMLIERPSDASFIGIQFITSTQTYVPTTGTTKAIVIAQGAGGGGGTAQATTAVRVAGNGGAGETRIAEVPITGNEDVVIDSTGGTGGTGSNSAGGTGGDTEFGSHVTAKGGTGGSGSGANTTPGANGSTPTGSGGFRIEPTEPARTTADLLTGRGGSSWFGRGGDQARAPAEDGAGGRAGSGYGAGGAGWRRAGTGSTGDNVGAAGSPGLVIVIEFGLA